MSPFALEATGGHGASTASVYLLFSELMRDSALPADVLVGKLKRRLVCASPGHDLPSADLEVSPRMRAPVRVALLAAQ